MLQQQKHKNAKILIEGEALTALHNAKKALADFTKLSYISDGDTATLSLTTDASGDSIGAILQQTQNSFEKPISFFSEKLNIAQRKYSTFSRELLTIYLSIRHFCHLLEGRDFIVFTVHKPLTYALQVNTEKDTSRDTRQLDYISQLTSDIRYIKGSDNIVADTLLRSTIVYWFGKPYFRAYCRRTIKRCHFGQSKRWHFLTAESTPCSIWNENNTLRYRDWLLKTIYTTFTEKKVIYTFPQPFILWTPSYH